MSTISSNRKRGFVPHIVFAVKARVNIDVLVRASSRMFTRPNKLIVVVDERKLFQSIRLRLVFCFRYRLCITLSFGILKSKWL